MKSLLDIQQDVRKLENSVQELSKEIREINADIDELRNSSEVANLDFEIINILSKNIRFKNHPLYKLESGRHCTVYLEMLLNIVRIDIADREATINRMIFVQWLQEQANIDWTLEKLYVDTFNYGKEAYCSLIDEIPDKYREYFILDALIVANIAGKANREIQEYIIDMATIMGIEENMIRKLAVIAKAVLCQTLTDIPVDIAESVIDDAKKYKHYLPLEMIPEVKKSLRTIVLELPDDVYDFRWEVKQYQFVEAGDVIASYKKRYTQYIKSTVSGTIFQFKDNRTYYGVVSFEKDSKDSIKEWIKKEGLK